MKPETIQLLQSIAKEEVADPWDMDYLESSGHSNDDHLELGKSLGRRGLAQEILRMENIDVD